MPTYLQPVETDNLTLPSGGDFHVVMKRRASYGDQLEAQNAMLHVEQGFGGTISKMEWGAYIRALTVKLITAWDLSDENGAPLPISAASLDRLAPEDGEFLASEAQKRLRPRSQEDAANFNQPSSDSSKATQ